jgi:import receptor subunit TOM22
MDALCSRAEAVSSQAKYVAKRLSLSVGKAAWLASTTLLVLLVPLVIEMDREAQLLDMEKEQMSVLTSPKSS